MITYQDYCAALILTQVVNRFPAMGTITTDLGCKSISSDLPVEERAYLLGYDKAELILQSEEHGVFRIPGELPRVGDYLLAVPGHICPTTILYPGIHVLDTAGKWLTIICTPRVIASRTFGGYRICRK